MDAIGQQQRRIDAGDANLHTQSGHEAAGAACLAPKYGTAQLPKWQPQ